MDQSKAKRKSNCVVALIMEVMRLHQARPDMGRRPRREADAEDDATEMEAAPADFYDVLGYRDVGSSVTTQQWLSMRSIRF